MGGKRNNTKTAAKDNIEVEHETVLLNDKKTPSNQSAWSGFLVKCKRMWPFVWPSNNCRLQLHVIACVIILVASRAVNVLIPVLHKVIVNSMTSLQYSGNSVNCENGFASSPTDETQSTSSIVTTDTTTTEGQEFVSGGSVVSTTEGMGQFRWEAIVLWIVLKTLQGDTGYLNILRTLLWIGVSQDTRKKMRVQLFKHLHSLSIRWHLHRKTGEVLRVMDRGVNSINVVLSHAIFNLLPIIADVVIAVIFFVTSFNWWMGFIVFTTMLLYAIFTVVLSEWRTRFRREMNDANNAQDAASVDSILNFETVKYHAAEDFETNRYAEAVDKLLRCEFSVSTSLSALNFFQKTTMGLGLLSGSLICARSVYLGQLTVGDYVLFISYVEQLYGPLNALGMYYRLMQQAFIDMENMFDMLDQKQEVVDEPDAVSLRVTQGEIRFDRVTFCYNDKKPLLNDVSFVVPPGKTYALVGPSGGGKSTFIRLVLRFYDIQSGAILIDGINIAKVTQKSLRQQIGVVPQDTVLFNNDIRHNIRYGNQSASDEEILSATKSADIHNFIRELPEGYDTLVGERGLRLSGGEKQRIAIARTLLKDPKIVLLDEATSALDTKTERNIQSSLSRMCENRTTVVVAHRLSTVIDADQILVIRHGAIVENGTHEDLLKLGKIYADMWQEQLRSNVGELNLHDLPSLPALEAPPPAFSRLATSSMPPPIVRSFSLPASELHPDNDPEEKEEEDLTLEHAEELCRVSMYDLTTPELEGSVHVMDHSKKVSEGGPGKMSYGAGRTDGEQRNKNLGIAQDKVSRGFLSIPIDLQKY